VTTISGRVSDLLEHDDADQYVLPDAAIWHWHDDEDLVMVDPQPDHWSRSIPHPLWTLASWILYRLPESIRPPMTPAVLVPAGSVDVGEEIEIAVEPVLDGDEPGADGETVTYRAVETPHPHAEGGSA